MHNNFSRVLARLKCCRVSLIFSFLYIEVWKRRCRGASASKSRCRSLTNLIDLLLDRVMSYEGIILKLSLDRELTSRDTVVACTMRMKCWSSGGSGCTIVLLSFIVISLWISIKCLLILQKYVFLPSSIPSAHLCLQISIITNFRVFTSDFDELQTLTVNFWMSSNSDSFIL